MLQSGGGSFLAFLVVLAPDPLASPPAEPVFSVALLVAAEGTASVAVVDMTPFVADYSSFVVASTAVAVAVARLVQGGIERARLVLLDPYQAVFLPSLVLLGLLAERVAPIHHASASAVPSFGLGVVVLVALAGHGACLGVAQAFDLRERDRSSS